MDPVTIGLLGVGLWGLLKRGGAQVMIFGQKALAAGKGMVFSASLPAYAQPYAEVMLRVAREEGIDPFLIFALGDRETVWGTSSALDRKGPAGKGDGGHGHGLMQIDDRSNGAWLAANEWWDPYVNVRRGVQILKLKLDFLSGRSSVQGLVSGGRVYVGTSSAARRGVLAGSYPDPRPLSGDALVRAGLAAYNTGEGNVLVSVAVGKPPEITTTGGNYGTDVVRRMLLASAAFDRAAASGTAVV